MRLVKSCEWLPQPVQDYEPIPLPFTFTKKDLNVITNNFSLNTRIRKNELKPFGSAPECSTV